MTLKLHNSIPKDPYTKQLCCTKWYRSEEISPLRGMIRPPHCPIRGLLKLIMDFSMMFDKGCFQDVLGKYCLS